MRVKLSGEQGSAMVHALVTGAIMGTLATGMASLTLMQRQLASRQARGNAGRAGDEAALAMLISFWSDQGAACRGMPAANGAGYTCAGEVGGCDCLCTPDDPAMPQIKVSPGGPDGACVVSITSAEQQR